MVMQTETVIGKNQTFVANSQNNVINGAKAKYLEGVTLAIDYLQAGTAEAEQVDVLNLVNPITIDIGGTDEIRTRALDLFALDQLWLGMNPYTLETVADNDQGLITGLWIPCWFPPVSQDTKISLTFNAVTGADTTQLSVTATMLDGVPRSSALHYTEFQLNTAGIDDTSFNNWTEDIDLVGDLLGVLFFETALPSLSVDINRQTIREIQIKVEGVNKIHYAIQELPAIPNARGSGQAYQGLFNLATAPLTNTIVEFFTWLPMLEPIPKDSQIRIGMMAGITAQAVRALPVQAIPF